MQLSPSFSRGMITLPSLSSHSFCVRALMLFSFSPFLLLMEKRLWRREKGDEMNRRIEMRERKRKWYERLTESILKAKDLSKDLTSVFVVSLSLSRRDFLFNPQMISRHFTHYSFVMLTRVSFISPLLFSSTLRILSSACLVQSLESILFLKEGEDCCIHDKQWGR